MNKKEALKELEVLRKEFKERADKLEGIINKSEVEYYDVITPVDKDGDILFNNNRQILLVRDGFYNVISNKTGMADCSKDFVWVPCKAEDIKTGDTFYCRDYDDKDFSRKFFAKISLEDNAKKYCFVDIIDIMVNARAWKYYYKLTKRSELQC